jgi:hypothetical protein
MLINFVNFRKKWRSDRIWIRNIIGIIYKYQGSESILYIILKDLKPEIKRKLCPDSEPDIILLSYHTVEIQNKHLQN